jgi:hypothetical protein
LVNPSGRFASDEDSYFQVATALLHGHQDIFWPPLTGWLIAASRFITRSDSLALVRLAWIAMDTACAAAIYTLAQRLGRSLWPADESRASRLSRSAALAYALYLPAISHAQFATSEIPALLGTLLVVLLVTSPRASITVFAGAGVAAGLLCLTRPSLLPLLVLVPAAAVIVKPRHLLNGVVCVTVGTLIVGGWVARNWSYAGEATISTNSAYNLFIGNRDFYAEDLNLFSPRATPEQIEFRRQQFSGQLPAFTYSPAESQRMAMEWITSHPAAFARRATGRLARVFVPKTDVLELLGGEQRAGVFAAPSLMLLSITNVEWAIVLFGGLAGLAMLRRTSADWSLVFASVIAGALVLCLIAISKPRYSFVFDPVLIICATALWMDRARARIVLTRGDRWTLAGTFVFLLWAWTAFAIFAISSRAT